MTRDPAIWPFDKLSPWNRPLGAHAAYEPIRSALTGAGFTTGGLNYKAWTVAHWIASTSDPIRKIYSTHHPDWDGPYIERHVPDAAEPSPDGKDSEMVIISPDHETVVELSRAYRLPDGNIQAWNSKEVSLKGDGRRGVVTNGMSLAGGNIRAGELRNGIHHVLNFTTYGKMWNRYAPQGRTYVWPARRADTCAAQGRCYGTSGNLYMGSWVAIPPNINIDSLGLETPEGRVLARALQDYGAIGTTTGGNRDRIIFRFDYAAYKAGDLNSLLANWPAFQRDLNRIARRLYVVINSHNNGGAPTLDPTEGIGGGAPRTPLAPDIAGLNPK